LRCCVQCGRVLPIDEFYKHHGDYTVTCKKCKRGYTFSGIAPRKGPGKYKLSGEDLEIAKARFWFRNMIMSSAPLVPVLIREIEKK
jgi:hypothetical protein